MRIGLVNRVVDAEELEDVTVAYAKLAANAPLSIRAEFFIDQIGLERSRRTRRMDAMQQEAANWRRLQGGDAVIYKRPVFHGR